MTELVIPDPREQPTVSVTVAGRLLGLGRSAAYEAANRGDIPTLRIGRRMVVPTVPVLRMLGLLPVTSAQGDDRAT